MEAERPHMLLSVRTRTSQEGSGIIQSNLKELRTEEANGISQRANQMWDCSIEVSPWDLKTQESGNLYNTVADLLTEEKRAQARGKAQ